MANSLLYRPRRVTSTTRLKTRLFRKYDYQRAKCEDPTIIRGWFRLVQNTIAKYGIRSDDIWNFDETGFMMGVIMPEWLSPVQKGKEDQNSAAWKPGMDYCDPGD
ncbi:transposase [Fusarium oxysporum f. sp. phaseoli]